MKKLSLFLLVSVFALWGCNNEDDPKNEVVISLENQLTQPESEFIASGTPNNQGFQQEDFKDPQNLILFNHYYADWGSGYSFSGITYTNKTDVTTPGRTNISSITGKGKFGKTYLTVNSNDKDRPAKLTNLKSEQYRLKGAWVTNTTFAYLAIKDGNDGYLNETQFKAGDWFKLIAIGYNADNSEIGRVDLYLADYREKKMDIVNTWQWFNWSAIANAEYIIFELDSTDKTGEWIDTPAYFCLDGITLIEK